MTNISQHISNVTQVSRNVGQTIRTAVSAARIPPLVLALPLALVTIVFSFALVATIQASFVPAARDEVLQDRRNIFERYSDSLLQPAENCREWQSIDERVKRVLTDAGRHFGGTVLMTSCYAALLTTVPSTSAWGESRRGPSTFFTKPSMPRSRAFRRHSSPVMCAGTR